MKAHRIFGVVLRYSYTLKHSLDRLVDVFYWPLIDLLLFGLTAVYFTKYAPDAPTLVLMLIAGLLFWLVIWRGQYEVTIHLLEDMWNRNLLHLFVAPLKLSEWLVSVMLMGLIKAVISFSFTAALAYVFFKANILVVGWALLPFAFLLTIFGWTIGTLISGIVLRFGTKVQALCWTLGLALAPFSAIYYPLSTLPDWAQQIAVFIPTSYIFEGVREVILTGQVDAHKLLISAALSAVFFTLAIIFFYRSFKKLLRKGLVKAY